MVRTNYRPLGADESLLLIILDDLGRANLHFVRVKPDVTKRASLTQEVPALIQFDLDLRKPFTIDFRKYPLLIQSVFLCGQLLNVLEDGLILGILLHSGFLPCQWDGTVHGYCLMLRPRQTSVNGCADCYDDPRPIRPSKYWVVIAFSTRTRRA